MVHTSKPFLPLNSRFLTNWLIRQTTQCPLSKIFQFVHWFRLVHHCVLTNWPMTVQLFCKWKSPNFDHMQYKRKKSWPFIQNFSMIYWWCHVIIKPFCLPKETSITKMFYIPVYIFDNECKTKCNFRNKWTYVYCVVHTLHTV